MFVIWPKYSYILCFSFCGKGRKCIPDANDEYFLHRDPEAEQYRKYCRNMRTKCLMFKMCKYTSEDTNDDINLAGKYDEYEFHVTSNNRVNN